MINPVEIEQSLLELSQRIEHGATVVRDAEAKAAETRRDFDRAWAMAFGQAEGSVDARKNAATLATMSEREAYEIAEVAFHHAQRLSRALEKKLDALRSISASVRTAYAGSN